MKAKTLKWLPAFAWAAITLSGCQMMADRVGFAIRSSLHADAYASLDPATKDRLRRGEVALGDTPEMVGLALGAPDAKAQGDGSVRWSYLTFRGESSVSPMGQPGPYRSNSLSNDKPSAGGRYDVGRRITFRADAENRLRVVGW